MVSHRPQLRPHKDIYVFEAYALYLYGPGVDYSWTLAVVELTAVRQTEPRGTPSDPDKTLPQLY